MPNVGLCFISKFSGVCGLKFHPLVRILFLSCQSSLKAIFMNTISKLFHEFIGWTQTYFVFPVLSIYEYLIYCSLYMVAKEFVYVTDVRILVA